MVYINNGEHDNPHELSNKNLEGSLNTENAAYTHTNFGTKLPEETEKLEYVFPNISKIVKRYMNLTQRYQ